jgi:uncharacterized protein Veg
VLFAPKNEKLKRGDGKNKPKKQTCHYAKMKKIKKGDGQKKTHLIPVWKLKSKKGGRKKNFKKRKEKKTRKKNQNHLCPLIMNSPTLFMIKIKLILENV